MDYNLAFILGVIGGIILVLGAAWPDSNKKHPARVFKNWLLALGGGFTFAYALLNYLDGGIVFFVLLQVLVVVATFMMLLDANHRVSAFLISLVGAGMVAWAFYLFEDYTTLLIVLGIVGIGVGYVLPGETSARNTSLAVGSIFIALFSWIVVDWVFFWLNVFFALFAGFYAVKLFFRNVATRD
jgi:hypothetical protein